MLLTTEQLSDYFPDLADPDMESASFYHHSRQFQLIPSQVGRVLNLSDIFATMERLTL